MSFPPQGQEADDTDRFLKCSHFPLVDNMAM